VSFGICDEMMLEAERANDDQKRKLTGTKRKQEKKTDKKIFVNLAKFPMVTTNTSLRPLRSFAYRSISAISLVDVCPSKS
jgi:hypothetical protein